MDLSKLNRLSKTPGQSPEGQPSPEDEAVEADAIATDHRLADAQAAVSGSPVIVADPGPFGWIGLIVGFLLILLYPRFWQYLSHRLLGTNFAPYLMPDGSEVSYLSTLDFKSDLVIALFALALVVEGIVLVAIRRRWAIGAALGLAGVATLANVVFVVWMFGQGAGLQLMSLLAVIFGVWMCFSLFALLKRPAGERYVMVRVRD